MACAVCVYYKLHSLSLRISGKATSAFLGSHITRKRGYNLPRRWSVYAFNAYHYHLAELTRNKAISAIRMGLTGYAKLNLCKVHAHVDGLASWQRGVCQVFKIGAYR